MKARLQSLIAKIKVRKLRIFHWAAVIALSLLFISTISNTYFDSSKHIIEAEKNGQLMVFDLATNERIPASIIATPPEKKDPKKGAHIAAPQIPSKKSEVMLVIGNLGLNNNSSEKAITLPPEVILSFSPYSERSFELSQQAKESGHIVLVDIPVQMKDPKENPGNLALKVDNSDFRNRSNFNAIISKVAEPSGVITPQNDLMTLSNNFVPILKLISDNRLFLVYGGESEDIYLKAKDADVGMLKVDVILDEKLNTKDVAAQIADAEALSQKSGFALVLVSTPSPAMVDQIGQWVKTLPSKNINLVSSLK